MGDKCVGKKPGNQPHRIEIGEISAHLQGQFFPRTGGCALLLFGLGIFLALSINADGLDDLILLGTVVHHVAVHAGDCHSGLNILGDGTESGVLTIQMGSGIHHDEELAAGAVGMHGTVNSFRTHVHCSTTPFLSRSTQRSDGCLN